MEISVGTYSSVRYLVEVRYWECPLIESPLYYNRHTSHIRSDNYIQRGPFKQLNEFLESPVGNN